MTERLHHRGLNWHEAFERVEATLVGELGESNKVASLASNPEQLYKNAEIAAGIAMAKASLLGNGERGALILHDLLEGIERDTVPYRYAKAIVGLASGQTQPAEDFLGQEWYSISSLGDDQEDECTTAVSTALLLSKVRRDGYGAIAQRGSAKITWNLLNALIDDIHDLEDPSARMFSIVELGRVLTKEYDVIYPTHSEGQEVDSMTGHSEMLMHKAIITFPATGDIRGYRHYLHQLRNDDPERYTAALVAIINRIANEPYLIDGSTSELIEQAVRSVNTGTNAAVNAYYYAQIAAACSAVNARSTDAGVAEVFLWDGSPYGFEDWWLLEKSDGLSGREKTFLWKTYFEKYIFGETETAEDFLHRASTIITNEFPVYDKNNPEAKDQYSQVLVSVIGRLAIEFPQRAVDLLETSGLEGNVKNLAKVEILRSLAHSQAETFSEREVLKLIKSIKITSQDDGASSDYYLILGKLCAETASQAILEHITSLYENEGFGASELSYFLEGAAGGFKGILKRRFS